MSKNKCLVCLTILVWPNATLLAQVVDVSVPIQGGTFRMGTDAASIAELKERYDIHFPSVFENETPARTVTLSDFRIDRYEVSNARFAAFVAENPGWRRENLDADKHNGNYLSHWARDRFEPGTGDHPVAFVTWSAAQTFCRWSGGRLPTEAEWEYVARAGDAREFPWGDQLPTPERANYFAGGHDRTTRVGSYPPNEFGVYDLAGNVWEFLYDAWQSQPSGDTQTDPIAGGRVSNEQIINVNGRRSIRGASFGGSVVNLRTRWRDSHVASNAVEFVGFRCAYPRWQSAVGHSQAQTGISTRTYGLTGLPPARSVIVRLPDNFAALAIQRKAVQ